MVKLIFLNFPNVTLTFFLFFKMLHCENSLIFQIEEFRIFDHV